jgi:hypothetical protein
MAGMSEDLHLYDGRTRRFRHDDADPAQLERGRGIVARLLRRTTPPPLAGLRYDLAFYSGGDGVFDRLYVALPCTEAEAEAIVAAAGFRLPDGPWPADEREDLEWMIGDEEQPERTIVASAVAHVAERRAAWQPAPDAATRVWFMPDSNVNTSAMLYTAAGELAYIGEDQG